MLIRQISARKLDKRYGKGPSETDYRQQKSVGAQMQIEKARVSVGDGLRREQDYPAYSYE